MRRVNIITYDLIKDKYSEFLKDIKPEQKGKKLNIISSENQNPKIGINAWGTVIFKQFRIR